MVLLGIIHGRANFRMQNSFFVRGRFINFQVKFHEENSK